MKKHADSIVMGKLLDSPEKGNVDKMSERCRKMSEKCPKIVRRHCEQNFRTFLGHFLPIWSVLLFGDPVQCSPVTTIASFEAEDWLERIFPHGDEQNHRFSISTLLVKGKQAKCS